MTDKRKTVRAEARQCRADAASKARQEAETTGEHVAKAVRIARTVLSDKGFTNILHAQGVQHLPRSLVTVGRPVRTIAHDFRSCGETLGAECLNFAIAWTFFFPLFANPAIAAHLETAWPGFMLAMKDAFISLVTAGPFPR